MSRWIGPVRSGQNHIYSGSFHDGKEQRNGRGIIPWLICLNYVVKVILRHYKFRTIPLSLSARREHTLGIDPCRGYRPSNYSSRFQCMWHPYMFLNSTKMSSFSLSLARCSVCMRPFKSPPEVRVLATFPGGSFTALTLSSATWCVFPAWAASKR